MSDATPQKQDVTNPTALESVADALRDLAFGSVEITVHDGRIVEIERREKDRMSIPVDADPAPGDEDEH